MSKKEQRAIAVADNATVIARIINNYISDGWEFHSQSITFVTGGMGYGVVVLERWLNV